MRSFSRKKKVNMVLNVRTETMRLIRDGENGGEGVWTEVGGEGDYIPIATRLSPPE